MFVEEGFRIRFMNGESIDFYADNPAQKEQWMKVLSEAVRARIGASSTAGWVDIVLARERTMGVRKANELQDAKLPLRGASRSAPTSPVRKPVGGGRAASPGMGSGMAPSSLDKSPWQLAPSSPTKMQESVSSRYSAQPAGSTREVKGSTSRRQAVKSMIC